MGEGDYPRFRYHSRHLWDNDQRLTLGQAARRLNGQAERIEALQIAIDGAYSALDNTAAGAVEAKTILRPWRAE